MKIFSSEPLKWINNKIQLPQKKDLINENLSSEVWPSHEDDKEADVNYFMNKRHRS